MNDSTNKTVQVPLLDLKAQYAPLRDEIRAAIDEVCESQYFIMGPKVAEFESQVAEYCGCSEAVGVSSGTDALLLALMSLQIGPGDEVITTPFSFFATAGSIARAGARPFFVDIDPDTFNLSVSELEAAIENRCEVRGDSLINRETGGQLKAIMPVHLFGQMTQLPEIAAIARDFRLRLIEDAAQAIGSEDSEGRRAGSYSDVGCFSFFPSKNLGAFGDGGLCTSNSNEIAERMRILRAHGGKPKYYHQLIGGNFRLDALQAAVLEVKLKYLDRWTKKRQENAAFYDASFDSAGVSSIKTPLRMAGGRHIYNQYVIRAQRRDELREYLSSHAVGTEIYYPVALHLQKCFEYLGYRDGDFPVAEQACREVLALPIYPELTDAQLRHVVENVAGFYT